MDDCSSTILDRLLQAAGLRRDSQLAELLGVTPQAVSQARRKGRIPDGWILKIATHFSLSTDWVFFGRGEPRLTVSAETGTKTHERTTPRAGSVAHGATRENNGERSTADAPLAARRSPRPLPSATTPDNAVPPGSVIRGHSPATLTRYGKTAQPSRPAMDDEVEDMSLEMAMVPLVAARLAAGQGSLENESDVQGYFAFRQDWLCRKGNPDRMVLMKVFGDSMEPDIHHGDMVLVNQAHTQILGHAIYAVGVNEEIYIKQIETLPGGRLILRSLNPRYDPIEVSLKGDLDDSVRVIGRVIWWCREA